MESGFVSSSLCGASGGGRRWRVGAVLGMVALLMVAPLGVRADTAGGQGSSYPLQRQDLHSCTIWFPLFMHNADGWSSTLVIDNQSSGGISIDLRLRPAGPGEQALSRTRNILVNGSIHITSAELSLGESFTGSLSVTACPHEISGVVVHDRAGSDRMALESVGQPSSELFFPGVANHVGGTSSRVLLLNTDRSADAGVTVTFRATGEPAVERTIFIPRDATHELDLSAAPRGMLGIRVAGKTSVALVGALITLGPDGSASATGAVTARARRVVFPQLYRQAGPDRSLDSTVRVMNVREGGTQPRITFIDLDTGSRIGPYRTESAIYEGEIAVWALSLVGGLSDGKMYAAVVEADNTDPLVGMAFAHSPRGIAMAYHGVTAGHTQLSAPLLYRGADGMQSTIQLHNLTSSDGSVTINFRTPRGNRLLTWTGRIAGNATTQIPMSSITRLPDAFIGSADITTSLTATGLVTTTRLW